MDSLTESPIPTFDDVAAAHGRIGNLVRKTPVVNDADLDKHLGCTVYCKCENLQATGAFKLRGATNAVLRLREKGIGADVATHSSGNHGAALAMAARLDGRKAHVVMPENSVASKIRNVRRQGGEVIFCPPNQRAREEGLERLVQQDLVAIPPYDHADIICGQGTVMVEFLQQQADLDAVLTPVGGGGLISGVAITTRHLRPQTMVFAAEPEGAADTAASFARGERVTEWRPETIADGLRALVGVLPFRVISRLVDGVLTVSEEEIVEAMGLVCKHLGMLIEPSSATVIAAIKRYPEHFSGKRVGVVFSGGNVEASSFPQFRTCDGD